MGTFIAATVLAVTRAQPVAIERRNPRSSTMDNDKNVQTEDLQKDDTQREEQRSHGDQQNRSKKDGHTSQIGTSQDQTSQRHRGGGARRQE